MLYKQLARPHLEYCDFLVDSGLKKNIKKYDKKQNRAILLINYGYSENMTYAEVKRLYEIDSLYSRLVEHLLMQMCWHKDDADYIETSRPNMILRNHDGTKLNIKTTRNHRVHKSPYYCGVQLWEQITVDTSRLQTSESDFKKSIRDKE